MIHCSQEMERMEGSGYFCKACKGIITDEDILLKRDNLRRFCRGCGSLKPHAEFEEYQGDIGQENEGKELWLCAQCLERYERYDKQAR